MTADQAEKEQYEKQLSQPLLSKDAVRLLDPSTLKSELAYYEHGFDQIIFTIKGVEYSLPGCLLTLPIFYFTGYNRVAAREIYAKFKTTDYDDYNDSILSIFKMIILDRINRVSFKRPGKIREPKAHEAGSQLYRVVR